MVYTSIDGERRYTGIKWASANKGIALQILNERLFQKHSRINNVETPNKRISDAFVGFSKDKLYNLNTVTKQQYISLYNEWIETDYFLSQYEEIKDMIHKKIKEISYSKNTLWKRLQRLRKFFKYCIEEGYMSNNPIKTSMIPKYVDVEVILFTKRELDEIVNKAKEPLKLLIQFILITGFRIQECINLKWSDIDENKITVLGKGNHKRIFPIKPFPELSQILSKFATIKHERDGFVFGYKWQQVANRNLKQILSELGIKNKSIHTLRKNAMNLWEERGIDLIVRSQLAGNSVPVQYKSYMKNPNAEYFERKISSSNSQ